MISRSDDIRYCLERQRQGILIIIKQTVTMIKNQLFPVIDYRNGRYQGEAKNNTPNGVGFFMDKNFMLCLAEWISGEIQGHAIVIYPSGKIFCGKVQHKKHEGIYSYELAEDHAQLICSARNSANKKSRLVAILPLFKTILEIDNSPSSQATILRQYEYSLANEQVNLNTAATILDLDKDDQRQLFAHKNFIQFFKEKFDGPFPQHFEYFVNENKGQKKEYFIGLRGEGLGIKIQPTEQLSMNKKKTEHVYVIKAMGYFTKENQLRQMGIKTHDNNVKGLIIEQGIFSLPNTLMKYEPGKRPPICFHNFHNHMKRSLFYRDKVLDIDFLYQFQKEFKGFRNNFKKIEIQRIAQFTIQNPINNNQVLNQIQNNRKHKTQALQNIRQLIEVKTPIQNPYNFVEPKQLHPQLNINRVKQDIYRSLSKLKHNPISNSKEYLNTSYRQIPRIQKPIKKQVSPLSKLNTIPISHQPFSPFKNPTPSQGVSQVDNNESLYRQPFNPFSPFKNSTPSYGVSRMNNNESLSPHKPNKSKSPYSYLEDAYVQKRPLFQKTNTQLHRDISKRQFNYLNDENKYRSPKPRTTTVLPMSDKHFDRSFVERSTDYKASKGLSRPNYSYYFAENEERDRMDKINISPFRQRI